MHENPALSRRERQVMDILHRRGEATVAEILADLPDAPTPPAARSILRILGAKKLIAFRDDGYRYVYHPTQPAETAQETALSHVVQTYFGGAPEHAVAALLRMADVELDAAEIERLQDAIRRARQAQGEG